MRLSYRASSTTCLCLAAAVPAAAEDEVRIDPAQGHLSWLTGPYRQRNVPQINLNNTPRLDSLIHGGNLYLTAPDVVALAIENNLDVEVQRYGPLMAQEVLLRAQSGGVLRSVGLGVAAGPQSVSLQGVSLNSGGAAAQHGRQRRQLRRRNRHPVGARRFLRSTPASRSSPTSRTPPARRATLFLPERRLWCRAPAPTRPSIRRTGFSD